MLQTSRKKLNSGRISKIPKESTSTLKSPSTQKPKSTKLSNEQVFEISADPFVNTNLAEIIMNVNGKQTKTLLNLGVTKSVMNAAYPIIHVLKNNPTKIILQCANGKKLHNNGEVELDVSLNADYSRNVSAIVSDHLGHQFILGENFIDDLYY